MPGRIQRNARTRFSRGLSTAAADPGIAAALRSLGLLDVLSSMPAVSPVARLALKARAKSGLMVVHNHTFNTTIRDEPDQGHKNVDAARNPRTHKGQRDCDEVKDRRELSLPITPYGSSQ
jgi:hypothetical protein